MPDLTPMLKQYQEIKAQYKNELLLFRLGDFYELFGDDAKEASKILDIVLTARHRGTPHETPMCGIPHHALDNYLIKLFKAGKRVAVCEQVSDSSLPGLVRREVVQVVTPGATLLDSTLKNRSNNFIASVVLQKNIWGLAVADLTTGEFQAAEIGDTDIFKNEIFRFSAAEVIISQELLNDTRHNDYWEKLNNAHVYQLSAFERGYNILVEHFQTKNLEGFGLENLNAAIEAAGTLLKYLKETQKSPLSHITKIKRYSFSDFMVLDEATVKNLELLQTASGANCGASLLSVIDKTATSMAGRCLRRNLLLPLLSPDKINARLEAVAEIKSDRGLIKNLSEKLRMMADLERLCGRIGCRRANGRDLVGLKHSLRLFPEIKALLQGQKAELIKNFSQGIKEQPELVNTLESALLEEPAGLINQGGMIKDGYNQELDELRRVSRGGKEWLLELQCREIERTKINSLKVRYNSVFGYYIEISKANLAQVPPDYLRKQTLVNAERFITPELKEYEEKILGAEEKIIALELRIFNEILDKAAVYLKDILESAGFIAELDMLLGFALLAEENNYCLPKINAGGEIKIKNGRHPVIEKFQRERYVPNDLLMDHETNELILLTGPNMSGKSSFLRQTALICLLAQIGSFVPAETAELGVVDRIFTRVGASDNLAQGVSTFMAEMQEAANIINNATLDSLIILDELGRGTSTYDGVSIALAIVEYLHEKIRAKTLFATHYHELTAIAEKLARAENYCVAVSESGGKVVFLHKIVKGATSKSYGIEVARLAGLPSEIISRARLALSGFENNKSQGSYGNKSFQRTLPMSGAIEAAAEKIVDEIKKIEPEKITPIEALQKIIELKGIIKQGQGSVPPPQ